MMPKRTDYDSARKALIGHAAAFCAHPPAESGTVWVAINEFVRDLAGRGWTRRDVYELTVDILDDGELGLAERSRDELLDFRGSLTGDCAAECIPHFSGEPDDAWELARYARSKKWLS